MKRLGIRSVGLATGAIERFNDWWPNDVVEAWRTRIPQRRTHINALLPNLRTTNEKHVANLIAATDDPFIGIVKRPIHPADAPALELEVAAARDAIIRANVLPNTIDLLLSHSWYPDLLGTNLAPSIHEQLGLRKDCLAFSIESASNSFVHQLAIAEGLLLTGRAHIALLVQSTVPSKLLPPHLDHAAWFGDMATAEVVSLTEDGSGLIGHAHTTDGTTQGSLVAGTPGKRWHEGEPTILYSLSPEARDRLFFGLLDGAIEVADLFFERHGLTRDHIDLYASHQAFPWLQAESKRALGLDHVPHLETFAEHGNVVSCGLPYQLATAERGGQLQPGHNVFMWTGGSGMTNAALAIKWSAS